jgi:hypothetical protein
MNEKRTIQAMLDRSLKPQCRKITGDRRWCVRARARGRLGPEIPSLTTRGLGANRVRWLSGSFRPPLDLYLTSPVHPLTQLPGRLLGYLLPDGNASSEPLFERTCSPRSARVSVSVNGGVSSKNKRQKLLRAFAYVRWCLARADAHSRLQFSDKDGILAALCGLSELGLKRFLADARQAERDRKKNRKRME